MNMVISALANITGIAPFVAAYKQACRKPQATLVIFFQFLANLGAGIIGAANPFDTCKPHIAGLNH